MIAGILSGLVGAPCLTVGLFVATFCSGSLVGGAIAIAGVVLLAKGGES